MHRRFISIVLVLLMSTACMLSISPTRESTAAPNEAKIASKANIISRGSNTEARKLSKSVDAESAILLDMNNGDVLWQKNPDKQLPIASTTKMITAIIAIEQGNLNDDVQIDKDVLSVGAKGGIYLSPGETLKLKDLLYALMLKSANDSAVAIAKYISGSTDSFSDQMNKKAVSLGAYNTNFKNPHGLDDKNHYSTARDLSIIVQYGLENKVFSDIVSTKTKDLLRIGSKKVKHVRNSNRLLFTYKGARGVKTGYTNNAGYCLVATAKRNGISILSIVLGAKAKNSLYEQSTRLLDYGFEAYEERHILVKGKPYKTITSKYGQKLQLTSDRDLSLTLRKSSITKIILWSDNNIDVPCKEGRRLGKIAVLRDGRVIATANLVAKTSLNRPSLDSIMIFYWMQFIGLII